MTIDQVVRLLQRRVPDEQRAAAAIARLETVTDPIEWPSPETSHDDDLLTSATVLFLQPARAARAKRALRIAHCAWRRKIRVADWTSDIYPVGSLLDLDASGARH